MGAKFVVFPELALTTFFPRWWMEDQAEVDRSSSRRRCRPDEMQPLFDLAKKHGIGFYLGYAELTPEGRPLQHRDPGRARRADRRQVPQGAPARATPTTSRRRAFQHLEKKYFEVGDLGFRVWRFMDTSPAC